MTATLSIVLARGTPTCLEVLDFLRQWSAAELVKPFLWIDVDQADLDSPFAPLIAQRVSAEQAEPEDLLSHLARGVLGGIRVIVLETIGGSDEYSADFLERCHDLVDRVGRVMPLSIGTGGAPLTRMDTCRLVVPTSEAATGGLSTMDLAWTRTVVVSPEYRTSPESVPEYVREGNLPSHAAAHVAAIGGLWQGMPEGVLDEELSGSSSTGYQTVLVSRAFARIIRSDGMAEALAEEVAKVANGDEPVPFGVDTGTVVVQDDERMVTLAVNAMNREGHFDFHDAQASRSLGKRTAGWGEAIGHVLRFFGSCLRLLATVPLSLLIDAAEKGTTALTYGTGGTTEVKFQPTDERELEDAARQLLEDQLKDNMARVGRAELEQRSASTPALWQRLRELSFGLIDGAHPADVTLTQNPDGRVDVLRSRGSVVAPPFPSSVPSAGTVELLGEAPGSPRHGRGSAVDVSLLLGAAELADRRLRHLMAPARPDAEKATAAEVPDAAGNPVAGTEPVTEVPAAARKRISECADISLLEALVADADRVRRYQRELAAPAVRGSLHARLEASVDAASDAATAAVDEVTRPIDWATLKPTGVHGKRQLFLAGSYLGIAAWITLSVLTFFLGHATVLDWLLGVVARAFVGLVILVVVLSLIYFQAVSRFNRQVELALHQLIHDGVRAEAVVHERARLQNLRLQLRDWSSVIAPLVHEPVLVPAAPPESGTTRSADPARGLPAGVAVTVRPPAPPSRHQLEELLTKEIGRGWLSRTFHDLVDHAAYTVERPAADFLEDADNDIPSAPNGTRAELINRLRSGVPQREAAQALLKRAATIAMAREGATAAPNGDGDYLDAIVGQPTAFVQYPFTARGLVAKSFEPERSMIWAPIGTHTGAEAQVVRVIDRVVMAGRSYDISIRCDVSGELDPQHLHLFDREATFPRVVGPAGESVPVKDRDYF